MGCPVNDDGCIKLQLLHQHVAERDSQIDKLVELSRLNNDSLIHIRARLEEGNTKFTSQGGDLKEMREELDGKGKEPGLRGRVQSLEDNKGLSTKQQIGIMTGISAFIASMLKLISAMSGH